MNENIFRAYDIRGIFNKDLTPELAEKIGLAFGNLLGEGKEIIIGRDLRSSGETLKTSLILGLMSAGCNIIDVGIVPTPLVYFAIANEKKDGGIVITGSHLSPEWNGIKLCRENALGLTYETGIKKIKQMIVNNELRKVSKGKNRLKQENILEKYKNYILNSVNIERPLNVVIDIGNGTCGEIVSKIFEKLNCKIKFLYLEPNENFPNHIPDPLKEDTLTKLKEEVIKEKADLGIAFDGDGDRIGFVDEKGDIIRGDIALIVFAKNILEKNKGLKFLFEVRCSRAVEEAIKEFGGIPKFVRVGHSYIMNALQKEEAVLAGEMSGHYFFRDNFGYDDGIYATLKMIEILSKTDEKLSSIVDSFPKYVSTPEIRLHYPDEKKFNLVNRIKTKYENLEYKINSIDGIRIEFDDGWALVRASNTEPALVIRFEAKTEEKLNEFKSMVLKDVREEAKKDGIKIDL